MNPITVKTETPNSATILNSPADSIATQIRGGDGSSPRLVPANQRRKAFVIAAAVLAVALVLAVGIVPRLRAQDKLARVSQETAAVAVVVTNVTRSFINPELILPATVRAFEETTLYSRANGYLSKWLVDIGGKVETGQGLAENDTPELGQELNQTPAAPAQGEANLALAKNTSQRWKNFSKDRALSPKGGE